MLQIWRQDVLHLPQAIRLMQATLLKIFCKLFLNFLLLLPEGFTDTTGAWIITTYFSVLRRY